MKHYHPVRYDMLNKTIEVAKAQLDARMYELAARLGNGSLAFKKAATRLVDEQVDKGIDFKALMQRKGAMDRAHKAWQEGGNAVCDMNKIAGGEHFNWDDAHLMEFTIPHQNFYIHFGEEGGFRLRKNSSMFFDGMYVQVTPRDDLEGFKMTFVCNETGWQDEHPRTFGEAMSQAARFAWGWVPFDSPISDTLRERGMGGDLMLLNDPAILTVIGEVSGIIGQVCAAESEMVFKNSKALH
ncbi:Hypothetical protein NGAL_HAMBI2610_36200 [Neorhizobium galegae bv. orientalis]|nr:Hypothetical protein NGAL_HAMBI2610_36200 [Neorhizobium galegae bv. orientalis]